MKFLNQSNSFSAAWPAIDSIFFGEHTIYIMGRLTKVFPTNSDCLLTRNEVEEANKAVAQDIRIYKKSAS